MEIRVKTLTPLWTGGVDGKCDRIYETALLGSLRWWMEALVRGVGGHVCDPTKQECLYDSKKQNDGLCDVCRIFGATGWKRRFRLEVQQDDISDASIDRTIRADRTYKKNSKDKIPTWYFFDPTNKSRPNTPKRGTFTITIKNLYPKTFDSEILKGLIQFIADWSAIGARPQMGFGVIQVDGDRDATPLYEWLTQLSGDRTYPEDPSIKNIFFAKLNPKTSEFKDKSTFNLKYDLRQLFRQDRNLRHFIMGTTSKDRRASKIQMSRPYSVGGRAEMRVWGWVPDQAVEYGNQWSKEQIVEKIYQHLTANYEVQIWREMDSSRDTELPNNQDASAFLRSLLRLQEGG